MPHSVEIEHAVLSRMRADLTRPRWWHTVWGRVAIVTSVFAVGGLAVAGTIWLSDEPVTQPMVVHCFAQAAIHADGTYEGVAVAMSDGNAAEAIDNAQQTCADVWASGALDPSHDPLATDLPPGVVPDAFTTCVMSDGTAAVIPGRISCLRLKLHPLDSQSGVQQ
ncbi:hypothetical protein [Microbacterium ulmi]|uniref:Uncharacterized protein n=1 Tax=Microbacterium ulmi TaxID=179095 RepID=A0A7Y2Q2C4_9MICO|nr:hypothetical protein [Microbacterium ulmi]NII69499.1 hypothetical protein [Microbacterium ulmi]NNH04900.1 hypothetical protein [Microbacterium ulmi]